MAEAGTSRPSLRQAGSSVKTNMIDENEIQYAKSLDRDGNRSAGPADLHKPSLGKD